MQFARTGPPRYFTYPLYSLSALPAPESPRRVARPHPQLSVADTHHSAARTTHDGRRPPARRLY
ncbi:hypothetical protein B0H10DRAFT_2159016 [Mycena sp. CBHHK59/15]|nr:hypothetical protein B0H10DRAFT_2159016 [Mycena sp. CBHHK59/15]